MNAGPDGMLTEVLMQWGNECLWIRQFVWDPVSPKEVGSTRKTRQTKSVLGVAGFLF